MPVKGYDCGYKFEFFESKMDEARFVKLNRHAHRIFIQNCYILICPMMNRTVKSHTVVSLTQEFICESHTLLTNQGRSNIKVRADKALWRAELILRSTPKWVYRNAAHKYIRWWRGNVSRCSYGAAPTFSFSTNLIS